MTPATCMDCCCCYVCPEHGPEYGGAGSYESGYNQAVEEAAQSIKALFDIGGEDGNV